MSVETIYINTVKHKQGQHAIVRFKENDTYNENYLFNARSDYTTVPWNHHSLQKLPNAF